MAKAGSQYKRGVGSVFWGIVFLVVGLVIILNITTGWNLPILRILFGVLLIYWGVSIIFGSSWKRSEKRAHWRSGEKGQLVFTSATVAPKTLADLEGSEFNVVFSSGALDLSNTEIPPGTHSLEINTVFGEAFITISEDVGFEPRSNSVFGSVSLPRQSAAAEPPESTLQVSINSVFGSTRVVRAFEKDAPQKESE